MTAKLNVTIDAWPNGGTIPDEYAFGNPAEEGHVTFGRNRNPNICWSEAPIETRSFVIICHDPDVPSKPDQVNKEGMVVPADLPRVNFFHWVLVDVPAHLREIVAGEVSNKVTSGGKPIGRTQHGVCGINNYTDWFAGDADMGGITVVMTALARLGTTQSTIITISPSMPWTFQALTCLIALAAPRRWRRWKDTY